MIIDKRLFVTLVSLLVGATLLVSGCKQPKKKATKLFKQTVEDCRTTDKTFYQAELLTGDETVDVLTQACREEMGEVKVEKGIEAQVEVGPYTWQAGVDNATGIWVLKGVEWEPLQTARRRLSADEPTANELTRAADLLLEAQKQYGKSSWIRLKRLEALLRIREKTRADDNDSKPYELGDQARAQFKETLEWADSNSTPAAGAGARLEIVDYLSEFARQSKSAKDSLGSQDKHFEKTIEKLESEGKDKEAEKYRKDLEEMRKERPKKLEKYNALIEGAHTAICKQFDSLSTDGLEDEELQERIESARNGTDVDCEKLLDK